MSADGPSGGAREEPTDVAYTGDVTDQELGRNMDEVVRIVKGLQLFDTTHLMAPANWPHNEIIGDKVLVPPSTKLTDSEIAEQHVTQLSDWFRYRELV